MLPRLAGMSNTALWLHFAEEAVAFERGLSPLRGLPMPVGSDELAESTEEPWTDGSCLELLARQPVSPFPSITILQCGGDILQCGRNILRKLPSDATASTVICLCLSPCSDQRPDVSAGSLWTQGVRH